MRKKLLSLALALALCLSLFTVPASAAGAAVTEIVSPDIFGEFFIDIYGYDTRTGNMTSFTEGVALVGDQFAGYGAVDTTGKVIIPPHTVWSEITFQNGVAWISNGGVRTLMDTSGRELFTINLKDIGAYSATAFSDGLSRVYSSQTWLSGYLDMTGKLVIPMEYSEAGEFHDGMAKVYDPANAFYGFIDKTGQVVIPCQYDYVGDFTNGFARVRLGNTWSIIDKTGKAVNLPEGYSAQYMAAVSSEVLLASYRSTYMFLNKSGQIISGPYLSFEYDESAGLYRVKKDGKYGYVNKAGVEIIPCQYEYVSEFKDGFAVARMPGGTGSNIIDKTGKVTGTWTATDSHYGWGLTNVGNGCFSIYDNTSSQKRYGLVDYTGREIVPCKYKTIDEFSCGVVPVRDFTGKTGFVNTLGEEVVPCKFSEIIYRGEGVYQVKGYHDDDYRWSLIRGTGWTAPATSSTPSAPAQPSGPSANPTNSKVLVNGKEAAFDAYTIDGSNYFKLRDLAYVLNGTEKQFEVGWDNASKTITLTSGSAYTANGSEMAKGSGAQTASVSSAKLLIDGKEVSLTAYSINGNNYFKLRDIGQALDFGVGWDNASKTITIDTGTGYTA